MLGSATNTTAGTGGLPDVSVVVPAHDAETTLQGTLDALDGSTFAGRHEVVVVDDASRDNTANVALAAGVRVIRLAKQSGPAAARNAGIAASQAALIAFTDADCEPTPGWLPALVTGLQDADLVTGPVIPDPTVAAGPFDRTLTMPHGSPLFETANLGVRRAVAERVGGFEAFAPAPGAPPGLRPRPDQGHFGEDAVFGWRARRSGARVAFVPEALVHHAVFPRGPLGFIAERWRLRFFPALVRELPELRAQFFLRVFLSARTARFDLAAAGLLAAALTRRPALVLAATPYVRRDLRTQSWWRRSVLRHDAALFAADAVGLAALLRGSLATRRPLL